MEEKINIAEILKDKPQGTKLYSILSDGECFLNEASEDSIYVDIDNRKRFWCFTVYGSTHSFPNGCVLLFPSREMRDWEKFSWKKGDVLISDCGFVCIFKEWASDDYTKFNGCYFDGMPNAETAKYSKLDNNTAYGYIREIENRCGGKLNIETLEIEKQTEFKDGDIVTMHKKNCDIVSIFSRLKTEGSFYYYAFHAIQTNNTGVMDCYTTLPRAWTFFEGKMNFATDSEKQQLFDALAKEGKAWDAEKKAIVGLKPKFDELKPFDKVLVRDSKSDKWRANLFAYISEDGYYCCVYAFWVYCIPYAGNEHLLGTTKNVEG